MLEETVSKMKFTSSLAVIWCFSLMLTAFGAVAEMPSRSTVPLPDWRFTFANGDNSWASPAHDDSGWEKVTLPHTWNAFDGQDGGGDYRRGTG